MLRYSGRPVANSKRVLLQSAPSSSQAIIASVDDVPCPISAAGERKEIELSACRRRKALDATVAGGASDDDEADRSEEHTSELQSLMRSSYAVFCLKNKR